MVTYANLVHAAVYTYRLCPLSLYLPLLQEFYHRQVVTNNLQLPRILGMTASPINTKGTQAFDLYIYR